MTNIGYGHDLVTSALVGAFARHPVQPDHTPGDYPPGRDNDAFWPLCTAFYRRHRRAILTVNRFSGINTAVPLFKASLPF